MKRQGSLITQCFDSSSLSLIAAVSRLRARVTAPDRVSTFQPSEEWVALRTVGLGGVDGAKANATADIFGMGDGFEMVRVYTKSNAAEVVEGESVRDRPNEELVSDTVNALPAMIEPKVAICPANGSRPEPAPGGLLDLRPKAGGDNLILHREITPSVATRPDASTSGPLSFYHVCSSS